MITRQQYILDDGSKSAVVWVDKIEPVAANSLKSKVHFSSFSDQTVKEILNHLYAKMHVSQHTASKPKYQVHTDFTAVLTINAFDKYFKKVPKMVSGAKMNLSIGGQPVTPYTHTVNYNYKPVQAIDNIIISDIKVTSSPTCDCGGVKCGHPDEAGPGHARWCELMQGELLR